MMKMGKGYPLAAMLLIPGVLTLASAGSGSLGDVLEKARSDDYVVPAEDQILQAENAFRHWFAAEDRRGAITSGEGSGFSVPGLESLALAEPDMMVLTERSDNRKGRGLFAARTEGGAPLMIQAPHQYYDLRTGTIARHLFLESPAVAAAWNTFHRYHRNDSDLVHINDSYLHALSRAFADLYSDGRILQLHGFSRSKRETKAGRRAEAILSDGSDYPPENLARLTECLSQNLGIRALLYPRDVRELGATTNTVAADLRRRGFDGFVHLELDPGLRKRLARDVDARKLLVQCVLETNR